MKNQRLARELVEEIKVLLSATKSLMLSVSSLNAPIASYSPFALVDGAFYILVSELAEHTHALRAVHNASVLIIEDESLSGNIYARRRLQYDVSVLPISRQDCVWELAARALQNRHGEIVDQLLQLNDFYMFELRPVTGRYVKGFGQAFELAPGTLVNDQIDHIRR